MKTSKLFFMTAAFLLGSALAQAPKPAEDWGRFQFLIGEWEGVGSGKPGEAVGGTSFSYSLDRRILVRKNRTQFPPKAGEKTGISHEDLLIIYPSALPALFRAIYFDNEGHVIHYTVSGNEKPGFALLETDAAQAGPRFRLTYELKAEGQLETIFSVAPPGGEFKDYLRGSLRKKSPQ